MEKIDVIIVGAGAAGLMCAIEAGKRGRSVLVLDHANKPGKKILMSGGGRCNFTNTNTNHEYFISHNPQFCKSALSRYTPWDFIELVKKHNISFHEKSLGQLFCDNKSKDIVDMLLNECRSYGVKIQLLTEIKKITAFENTQYQLSTSTGGYQCHSLVIASGGLSIPTMGASPFAYKVAEQFAIKVWPTRAGLVPFTLHRQDKERFADLSGVSVECTVQSKTMSFRESMLFTHRGLSGPAMLQISSYWQPGETLTVDLLADVDIFTVLVKAKSAQSNILLKTVLSQYLPKRLVHVFMSLLRGELLDKTLQECAQKQLLNIANQFKAWQIKPNATEGYRTAEVTLGGVDCNALSSKTFEVKNTKGLYFIGEALDVTGWLGGYNFQWAWSSGVAAGMVV